MPSCVDCAGSRCYVSGVRGRPWLYVILLSLSACGSSRDGSQQGVDAPPFVAANHPPVLEFKNQGGPTLAHPSLVTVTWPGDPLASFAQTFDAWLATSQYLADGLREYGIASAAHAGAFVFADAAPASIDADEIGQKLADEAAAGLPAGAVAAVPALSRRRVPGHGRASAAGRC